MNNFWGSTAIYTDHYSIHLDNLPPIQFKTISPCYPKHITSVYFVFKYNNQFHTFPTNQMSDYDLLQMSDLIRDELVTHPSNN